MSLEDDIKALGISLGFDALGICEATRPSSAPRLMNWLDAGHHGEMGYMEREPERRADPEIYWPEARSMVMCLKGYSHPDADPPPEPGVPKGKVARYARGRDYHVVIKKALHHLGRGIMELMPGVTYRAVVDTSPILERAHAFSAGLGWHAKNTMILSRDHGSYTFIGGVLLDQPLSSDAPVTNHCGSCRACIDACPTDALLEPGVLDARRCISYLTIEHRGDLPLEHREATGEWLFGCDICQEVCPWVRKAGPSPDPGRLSPIGDRGHPSLEKILSFDQAGFSAWATKSPIKRAKLEGLQRNAAVCLGNSDEHEASVSILIQALTSNPSPLVRRHAAWGLGQQGGALAKDALTEALNNEVDGPTRESIAHALERSP